MLDWPPLARFTFRDLANFAWAAANLGAKPSDEWIHAVCEAAAVPAVAAEADASAVAGLLYALSRWRVRQLPETFLRSLYGTTASPEALKR